MKRALFAGILVAAVVASSAYAVAPWRVFASGTDSGDYSAWASASADAPRSQAFAVRATSQPGKVVEVLGTISCEFDRKVSSGTIVILSTPVFKKCNLSANVTTDYPGRARIELLRR